MLSRYSPRTTQQTFSEDNGRGWPHVALYMSCVHLTFLVLCGHRVESLVCCVLSPHVPHRGTEHRAMPGAEPTQCWLHMQAGSALPAGPTNHLTSFISFHDIRSQAGIVPWATGPASCPFLRESHKILPQPHWAEAASWWFKFSYCFLSSGDSD